MGIPLDGKSMICAGDLSRVPAIGVPSDYGVFVDTVRW